MKKLLHNGKMFNSPGVRTQVPTNIGMNYISKDIQKQKENNHIHNLWKVNKPF